MVEIFDNIRKIYQFGRPCEELADYIEFFSESSAEETARHMAGDPFSVKMFPSWTPTFWINLGASYGIEMGKGHFRVTPEEDILVLRDRIVARHNLPSDHIFTVKFFPGGLEAIFGISQTKFIGRVVALHEILPGRLIRSVKTAGMFEKRMELLQLYFLVSHARQKKRDHYIQLVRDSIDLYHAGNMQYNTGEVAEKMFVTSKTINRYFNNVVGLPPKQYFSILRVRAALTAYVDNGNVFIPEAYGYHDMSHFYKEAIRFTGQRMVTARIADR